jgi:hypothetical protein
LQSQENIKEFSWIFSFHFPPYFLSYATSHHGTPSFPHPYKEMGKFQLSFLGNFILPFLGKINLALTDVEHKL